jgi:protein-disulfide isomerase
MLVLVLLALSGCSTAQGENGSAAADGDQKVLAYVGDKPITLDEVDDTIGAQLIELRQQEYDLRKKAIDNMVTKMLLEQEAESRGITLAELGKVEVQDKARPLTEELIKQIYEMNKSHPSLKDKTFEELRPMLEQNAQAQLIGERQMAYVAELRSKANVRVVLEPPRVEVAVPDYEPSLGPADAPITFVEFADYQCPYCRRTQPAIERVLAEYGDKIRFVYRDYALNFHKRAEPAAVAARCAGDQDKFWDYHKNLMNVAGTLNDDDLIGRAERLGLDMTAWQACVGANRHLDLIQTGFRDGAAVGVTGTPTFFINGRMMVGAVEYEAMKEVIEDELARKGMQSKKM